MLRRSMLVGIFGAAVAPACSAASGDGRFRSNSVVLYSPEQVFEVHGPPPDQLAAYIEAIKATAQAALGGLEPINVSGALVIALKPPARSRSWVVLGTPRWGSVLDNALITTLNAVPAPHVTGVLAFAVNFDCGRGGPQPDRIQEHIALPEQWKTALGERGGVIPDDALAVVWPD